MSDVRQWRQSLRPSKRLVVSVAMTLQIGLLVASLFVFLVPTPKASAACSPTPICSTNLWKTGVSPAGTKLTGGKADPHYRLTAATKSCDPVGGAATTIQEYGASAGTTPSGGHPWNFVNGTSAWIGANKNGENISGVGGCVSPSDFTRATLCGHTPPPDAVHKSPSGAVLPCWVQTYSTLTFSATQKFAVQEAANINPSSIRLALRGTVDNMMAVSINGCMLRAVSFPVDPNTDTTTGSATSWSDPDFQTNNQFNYSLSGCPANILDTSGNNNNTLVFYVKSGYTLDGFNITGISLTADTLPSAGGCGTAAPNGAVQPGQSTSITASMNFGSPATATSAFASGSRVYVKVDGPSPSGQTSGGTSGGSSISYTTGPLGPFAAGSYVITYGLTGGTATGPTCTQPFTVANQPYFTVQGGDVVAGSAFASGTACTQPATPADIKSWNYNNNVAGGETGYYGAGSQAGAFASGGIASFITSLNPAANGTAVASRTATGAYTIANTGLSFSNTVNNNPALGNYGGSFGTLPCADDYASTVTGGTTTSGTFSDYSTSGTFTATSDLHLAGGTLSQDADGKGTTITIKVTGDVYIDGNILYNDGSTPTNIPRLNLYATGNIYVKGGPASPVTELHGFYVAQPNSAGDNGIFATCYDPATGSESTQYSVCNSKLTVYGAVYANTIDLDRSQGSLYSTNGPAEVFQYTPELWLSGSDGASSLPAGTTPKYDAVTSLPPVL